MTIKEKASLCEKVGSIPESQISATEVFRENNRFRDKSIPGVNSEAGSKIIDVISTIIAVIVGIYLFIKFLGVLPL